MIKYSIFCILKTKNRYIGVKSKNNKNSLRKKYVTSKPVNACK